MKKTFLAAAIASVLTVVSVMGAEIQPLGVDYEQKAKDNFQIIRTKIDNTKFLNPQALENFKQKVKSYIEEQYAGWNLEQTDASELENIFSSVELAPGIPMVRHNKTLPLINAALDKAVKKLAVTLKEKEEAENLGAIVHGNNNDNQNVDNHNENMQQAQKNNDLVQEQQDFLADLSDLQKVQAAKNGCDQQKGDVADLAIGNYENILVVGAQDLDAEGKLQDLMTKVNNGTIGLENFGDSAPNKLKSLYAVLGKYLEYRELMLAENNPVVNENVSGLVDSFEDKMRQLIADAKQAAEQPAEEVIGGANPLPNQQGVQNNNRQRQNQARVQVPAELVQLTTELELSGAIAFCDEEKDNLGQLAIGDYDNMLAGKARKLNAWQRLANLMDSVISGTITIASFGDFPDAQLKGVCAAFSRYLQYKKIQVSEGRWSASKAGGVFEKSEDFEKRMKELIASVYNQGEAPVAE